MCTSGTMRFEEKAEEVLLFSYFDAEMFHYMASPGFIGKFQMIHNGFKRSGLRLAETLTVDASRQAVFKPMYHDNFHPNQGAA